MNSIAKRYAKLKLKQDVEVMKEQKYVEKLLEDAAFLSYKRKEYNINQNNSEGVAIEVTVKEPPWERALTPKQELIKELITKQNNLCPICEDNLLEVRPNLDHCHRTNMIRGVLCNSCNVGLGFFADNPKFLEAAITYLGQKFNIVNDGYCTIRSR